MNTDSWTAKDPQPGDFDAVLATIDPAYAQRHDGDAEARMRSLVSVEGEDARRLERIAEARGKTPHDVVAAQLRRLADESDLPADGDRDRIEDFLIRAYRTTWDAWSQVTDQGSASTS